MQILPQELVVEQRQPITGGFVTGMTGLSAVMEDITRYDTGRIQ